MYAVYILISKDRRHAYAGCSANLERRMNEHNNGKVRSSRFFRPYDLLHAEQYRTEKEARNRELFYKSTTGRR